VYVSPISFIVAPELWVIAAARYKANHMQAPDFGYKLAAKRGPQAAKKLRAEGLDLRALCFCLSAAERVRAKTCAEFEAHFRGEFKFDAMFCPAYGLAESVVGVCSTGTVPLPVPSKETRAEELVLAATRPDLVCCAEEFLVVVKIVDKESRHELPSGSPGEIWARRRARTCVSRSTWAVAVQCAAVLLCR
jgi:acyl-CoA synthetase (AMP-forming)/AMP-acid ligase II